MAAAVAVASSYLQKEGIHTREAGETAEPELQNPTTPLFQIHIRRSTQRQPSQRRTLSGCGRYAQSRGDLKRHHVPREVSLEQGRRVAGPGAVEEGAQEGEARAADPVDEGGGEELVHLGVVDEGGKGGKSGGWRKWNRGNHEASN